MKTSRIKIIINIFLIIICASCTTETERFVVDHTITRISPTSGKQQSIVTIMGENFGADSNQVQVFFNNVEAVVKTVKNNQIEAKVPAKAGTGEVKVIINGKPALGPEFTYIKTAVVSTLAGSGEAGYRNGKAEEAQFIFVGGMDVDSKGNLFVTSPLTHTIRIIRPDGDVLPYAGVLEAAPNGFETNWIGGYKDGDILTARFYQPSDLVINDANQIFIADSFNHRIRNISPLGLVTTRAKDITHDETPFEARQVYSPVCLANTPYEGLVVGEFSFLKLRRIVGGTISTIKNAAGNNFSFTPYSIVADSKGYLYIPNGIDGLLKIKDITGETSIFAPDISFGDNTDTVLAIDKNDIIYITDNENNIIKKITPDGTVTILAGSGIQGYKDGLAEVAQFRFPTSIAVDNEREIIYVYDTFNYRIRKITFE